MKTITIVFVIFSIFFSSCKKEEVYEKYRRSFSPEEGEIVIKKIKEYILSYSICVIKNGKRKYSIYLEEYTLEYWVFESKKNYKIVILDKNNEIIAKDIFCDYFSNEDLFVWEKSLNKEKFLFSLTQREVKEENEKLFGIYSYILGQIEWWNDGIIKMRLRLCNLFFFNIKIIYWKISPLIFKTL